jgi:hypothetical protein
MKVNGQLHASTALHTGTEPPVPVKQEQCGAFGKRKHLLLVPRIEPVFLCLSSCSLVIILTGPFWLLFYIEYVGEDRIGDLSRGGEGH